MIQVKVTRARFAISPRTLRRPASLGTAKGRIRRGLPIHENERAFRRDIARDYRENEVEILAALRESGALERVAKDAAAYLDRKDAERRREQGEKAKRRPKKPIGRGGTELSAEHQEELRRIFSRGALGFVADLIADPVNGFEVSLRSTLDDNYHDLFDVGGRAARLNLGVSGAFDLRSPAISETLASRANLLAGPVSDDQFERMLTIIAEEFYLQGEGPLAVARTLEEEFDWLSRERAERIARTETLSVTEEAQWLTYSASGVEWKRWLTTLDGAERESHFAAHGQLKAIDEPFEVGVSELMYPGDPDGPPDEIVNCFPGDVRVGGRFDAALRVNYSGPMRKIITAGGRQLSVTPNHPVLTVRGFVPAHSVCKGDQVLCDKIVGKRRGLTGIVDHEKSVPPMIQQVFNAMRSAGRLANREVTIDDFHGDAAFMDGEVDIIRAARLLRADTIAEAFNSPSERMLVSANIVTGKTMSGGAGNQARHLVMGVPASRPCVRALLLDKLSIEFEAGPFQFLRCGAIANINSSRFEPADQRYPGDAVLVAKLLYGSAGYVCLDDVVEVRDEYFAGHVYDLQSPLGWIVADGILASNCRCAQQAVVDESQVFNDRAVWNGDIDPDEFAQDREKRLTIALGWFDDWQSVKHLPGQHEQATHAGGGGARERKPAEKPAKPGRPSRAKPKPAPAAPTEGPTFTPAAAAKQELAEKEAAAKLEAMGPDATVDDVINASDASLDHALFRSKWTFRVTDELGLSGKVLAGTATAQEKARWASQFPGGAETGERYLRDAYATTQAAMDRDGLDEVTLYRGICCEQADAIRAAIESGTGDIDISTRSFSSFSTKKAVAEKFVTGRGMGREGAGKGGLVIKIRVPRSQIFAHPKTQPNLSNRGEDEAIVLTPSETLRIRARDIVLKAQVVVIPIDVGLSDNWINQIRRVLEADDEVMPDEGKRADAEKAEREYVRDESGRFAETEGAEAEEAAKPEAPTRMSSMETRQALNQALDEFGRFPSEAVGPVLVLMRQDAQNGDYEKVNARLENLEAVLGPEARPVLDAIALPIMAHEAELAEQWLPRERAIIGAFYTDSRGEETARRLEKEIADRPREKAYLVDREGRALWDSGEIGSYHSTAFTPDEGSAFGGVMVHNHPNSNSLSFADISVAERLNLSEVRAVGYDGSIWRASPRRGNWGAAMDSYRKHNAAVRTEYTQKVRNLEMTLDEANTTHHHEVWKRVANEGLISYEYDPNPADR